MAVGVAVGLENGGHAQLGHAHEGMAALGRQNGIGRNLHATVGAIFESHRAGQAAGQLAVALAFGGTGADGTPGDQFADELGGQQVEEFGSHRQAQFQHIEQQGARHFQPVVDGVAVVHVGVVDVPLPADGGARLFEVDTHEDQQVLAKFVGVDLELARVLHGLGMVVDGAGANDHEQAVILTVQDAGHRGAAVFHQLGGGVGGGQPFLQQGRRDQRPHGLHAGVVDAARQGGIEGFAGAGCGGHGNTVRKFFLLTV